MHKVGWIAAAVVGCGLAGGVGSAGAAIIPGQIDDFENGSVLSWQNGPFNPAPAANIASGGPDGPADNYLRISADGSASGGKLVVFNPNQWAGNYLGAGVTSVRMQVNNLGSSNLALRLILVAPAGQSLTTVSSVNLPAGSGWREVSFALSPTTVIGGVYGTIMGNVTELNLVHSPAVIPVRSLAPDVVAQLGVDDITAVVPEPGSVTLAAGGVSLALCLRRRGCA